MQMKKRTYHHQLDHSLPNIGRRNRRGLVARELEVRFRSDKSNLPSALSIGLSHDFGKTKRQTVQPRGIQYPPLASSRLFDGEELGTIQTRIGVVSTPLEALSTTPYIHDILYIYIF
jgi:hypothetical protein